MCTISTILGTSCLNSDDVPLSNKQTNKQISRIQALRQWQTLLRWNYATENKLLCYSASLNAVTIRHVSCRYYLVDPMDIGSDEEHYNPNRNFLPSSDDRSAGLFH